jgi:hypothetical protein
MAMFASSPSHLAEQVDPEAERIRLVCDPLDTHPTAAFYERYPPEPAQRLAERVEFIYTPTHGSWLNVVEIEFSTMVRRCLRRRLGTRAELSARSWPGLPIATKWALRSSGT